MFGNLRWHRCGKSDAARRLYKAQLCAACHAMREFSGRPSALLANYDQSLLVLVLSALQGGALARRRCTGLPWRTIDVQQLSPELRTFVAAGNLALIDAKLRDDIDDGGRWYARPARFALWRKQRKARRALRQLGFPTAVVAELPQRQREVEDSTAPGLEALAAPSAELLGTVFAHGAALVGDDAHAPTLRRFGAWLARAIYGLDALEDHDEDRRRGRFNALACLAEQRGHAAAVAATCQFVATATQQARQLAGELLPADRQDIVASILHGMAHRAERHGDHLLGRPEQAAMRPAEAGDCDCPCTGCDGCDGCDCCNNCDGCGSGCDICSCCDRGERKRRRDEAAAGQPEDQSHSAIH